MRSERPGAATPRPGEPGFGALLLAALAGFGTCGLWLAWLTLELNPELSAGARDAAILVAWFAVAYGALGAAAALVAGAAVKVVRRLAGPAGGRLAALPCGAVLALAPVAWALLLPDTGLHRTLLTDILFGGFRKAVALAAAVLAGSVLLGLAFAAGRRRMIRIGLPASLLPLGLWLGVAVSLAGWAVLRRPEAPATEAGTVVPAAVPAATPDAGSPPAAATPRVPVVLLCIDGADPDDAVWPLIEAGVLPAFRRLRAEGAWGALETFYPTLSPAIWTTLATGKPPAEHGVHHFVVFDLPGMSRPVRHFPLHAGLNFRLVSWLERLPGAPAIRVPYSSNLRRTRALWNVAGEHMPVGVYGWRVTWPAEAVDGFNVATGVTLLGELTPRRERPERPPGRSVHPPDAFERARAAGLLPDRFPARERTLRELIGLVGTFRPGFVGAGFYSVDAAQHHHSSAAPADAGGLAAPVAAAYRRTDRRLGELLAALDRIVPAGAVNLIVVSDHGFDFEHHHHTHRPAGIFFGHGPAFRRGARVEGLTVYDVAPMVLHLLGLPLADDMPGTAAGRWRRPLADPGPAARVATYERGPAGEELPVEDPLIEETKRRLRALGYLQ